MGPGTRGKQTSLVLFCFVCFVREIDVNERANSDTGEAGFNEMRVQFHGGGAIRVQFSSVWLQYCIILNSVLQIVCVWIDVTWFIVAGRTGKEVVKCTWSWARVRYRTHYWRG